MNKLVFCAFFFFCLFSVLILPAQSKSSKSEPGVLRVLNYNIHHANPPSKPDLIDLEAIARVIRNSNADVVALQEVDSRVNRSGGSDQAKILAEMTGLHHKFFRAIDHDGGEYGLAILSRKKLRDVKLVELPQKVAAEQRILAYATIKAGKQKFILANTHLEASKAENRIVQMQRIVEEFQNSKLPVIICGDFNSVAGSETVNLLDMHFKRTCTEDCPYTIPQVNPKKTIDFIATRNVDWPLIEHKVIAEPYASDHLPVMAVFSLKK